MEFKRTCWSANGTASALTRLCQRMPAAAAKSEADKPVDDSAGRYYVSGQPQLKAQEEAGLAA